MLHQLTESELRQICKERIESLEHWLRRLIDQTLTAKYGDYFYHVDQSGNKLISTQISRSIQVRQQNDPNRYGRLIDATLLEDAISIICNPRHYPLFSRALNRAYPEGADVAKTFMQRIVEPRNRLAHSNAISVRQAEQVLCYSNDVISSIKNYYSEVGLQQDFNVPLILRYVDSCGNERYRSQLRESATGGVYANFLETPNLDLRPGETLSFEVEIDSTFDAAQYTLSASPSDVTIVRTQHGCKGLIALTNKHVGEVFVLQIVVTTTKEWHRYSNKDDSMAAMYRVLPPILE